MFSAVIKAKVIKAVDADEKLGQEVAIKVIRSQESMWVTYSLVYVSTVLIFLGFL